jgi:hypothetical protein
VEEYYSEGETIPLRWAFAREMIEKDIVAGITWFSGEAGERKVLPPGTFTALFRVEWGTAVLCLPICWRLLRTFDPVRYATCG